MFRVFQIDPETAALHINGTAIQRHARKDDLNALVEQFFCEGPLSVLGELAQLDRPDPDRCLIYSSLLHELRHYVDLVFTPYGFHRLRTAFECYHTLTDVLVSEATTCLPIPLISGVDPVNQRMLGLTDYAGSLGERYANLLTGRTAIIMTDNADKGGDIVLEALAFSQQAELAVTLFTDPVYHNRMPYLYGEIRGGLDPAAMEFNLKYRWHYALAAMLRDKPDANVMRLVYWILFASLCGSIARDAKYTLHRVASPESFPDATKPGRFVDGRLPSRRIRALIAHFQPRVKLAGFDWGSAFAEVDAACRQLFGLGLHDEIAADIESDQKLLEQYRAQNSARYALEESVAMDPIWAFDELVELRREFLGLFTEDPERFVSPVKFLQMMTPQRLPRVVYEFPHGVPKEEIPSPDWRPVFGLTLSTGDGDIEEIYYSFRRLFETGEGDMSRGHTPAWDTLLGILAPAYKVLLYGNRYFALGEPALARAPLLHRFKAKFRWDSLYAKPRNIGDADGYLDFFGLDTAQCEVCGSPVGRKQGTYVSGWTVRRNDAFVRHISSTYPPPLVQAMLVRDWSGWLMCSQCRKGFGFN